MTLPTADEIEATKLRPPDSPSDTLTGAPLSIEFDTPLAPEPFYNHVCTTVLPDGLLDTASEASATDTDAETTTYQIDADARDAFLDAVADKAQRYCVWGIQTTLRPGEYWKVPGVLFACPTDGDTVTVEHAGKLTFEYTTTWMRLYVYADTDAAHVAEFLAWLDEYYPLSVSIPTPAEE